jgi:hypothetical protein
MSGLALSRRAMLQVTALGAGALVAASLRVAALAAAAPSPASALSAMLAAWIVLRPEAGADVRFAYLDARGRPLRVLPVIRLEARHTSPRAKPTSSPPPPRGQARPAWVSTRRSPQRR